LPFRWDLGTIKRGLNFTLTTDLGNLDLLGEVTRGGDYEQLLPFTVVQSAFGIGCSVVTLPRLIQLKRAAGRAKDLEVIAELEALLFMVAPPMSLSISLAESRKLIADSPAGLIYGATINRGRRWRLVRTPSGSMPRS
jgi:hypothetical protein